MKKTLFIAALAALGLTACTQDEPVSINHGSGISFRPAMGNLTRATETTNANLSEFTATALIGDQTLFNQLEFTKGSDGFFTSSPVYYWPGDNSEVSFYAYSPSADALGADVTLTPTTKTMENFSPAEDIADQVDFITANATGTKNANEASGVELTFNHQLTQIELRAKTDNTAYVYKVAGMRIGRAQTTASFDFSTSQWTLDDWHETTIYQSSCDPVTLSSTPVSIMGASGNAMLIPQTLIPWSPQNDPDNVAREAYLSVLLQITSADGAQVYPFPSDKQLDTNGNKRTYAWASIPLSGTWEAGKKYIYTLDFTNGAGYVDPDDPTPGNPVLGKPIKFTVQVTPWTDSPVNTPMVVK